ncbi:conserved hypothetical protein [Burkholderia pseudomallei 576]|nr:conserved hypothetical protein [Burkholderia pseudomallei 576]
MPAPCVGGAAAEWIVGKETRAGETAGPSRGSPENSISLTKQWPAT